MSTKRLIKIEEKVAEILEDPNGRIHVKELSPQEGEQVIFEGTVLGDDFDKLFENELNEQANKAHQEILLDFRKGIRKTVLATLGFEEDSFGRGLRVDHSNGRVSAVSKLISGEVQSALYGEMTAYIQENGEAIIEEVKETLLEAFRSEFVCEVEYNTRTAAREAARQFLERTMDTAASKYEKPAVEAIQKAIAGSATPVKPARTSEK